MSTSLNVVSIAIVCWASTSRRATVRRNMLMGTTSSSRAGASFGSDCACGAASVRAATGLASGAGAASPAGASGVSGSVTGVSEGCSSGCAGWVVASSGLVDGCFFAGVGGGAGVRLDGAAWGFGGGLVGGGWGGGWWGCGGGGWGLGGGFWGGRGFGGWAPPPVWIRLPGVCRRRR